MSWSCLKTLRHMWMEPHFFQGKERHHSGKNPQGSSTCAAWLTDIISPDYTKVWPGQDACAVPGCHDSRMQPHHLLHIQTHKSSPLQVLWLQINTRRDKPAKPWINLRGSQIAVAVTTYQACFGWLCMYCQPQPHCLAWLEKAPQESLHAQKHTTEFGEEREWCQTTVTGCDRVPQNWWLGRKNVAYTKLPHFRHMLLPTAPCCTMDI